MRESKSVARFDRIDTPIVFIDPQNDVLSEKGAAWEAVGVVLALFIVATIVAARRFRIDSTAHV